MIDESSLKKGANYSDQRVRYVLICCLFLFLAGLSLYFRDLEADLSISDGRETSDRGIASLSRGKSPNNLFDKKAIQEDIAFSAPKVLKGQRHFIIDSTEGRGPSSKNNQIGIKWRSVKGAIGYEIQISPTKAFEPTLIRTKIQNPAFIWEMPRLGKSFWRVRALGRKGGKGPYTKPYSLRVEIPPPILKQRYSFVQKVNNPNELNGIGLDQTITINWAEVALAERYRLVVSADPKFRVAISELDVLQPSAKLQLDLAGEYYARIAALNGEGRKVSPYSRVSKINLQRFLQLSTPKHSRPNPNSIFNLRDKSAIPVAFSWDTVKFAKSYVLQVSTSRNFEDIIVEENIDSEVHIVRPGLPWGTYYWRIKANRDNSTSRWSKSQSFRIQSNN